LGGYSQHKLRRCVEVRRDHIGDACPDEAPLQIPDWAKASEKKLRDAGAGKRKP